MKTENAKSRFFLELEGKYGEFLQKCDEERIGQMQKEIDCGEVSVDADGAAYWTNSGVFLTEDCAEATRHTGYEFSLDATEKARKKQLQEAIEFFERNCPEKP